MGNLCSMASDEQNLTTDFDGKCYKVSLKESCMLGELGIKKAQNATQFLVCAFSALVVFIAMDKKNPFVKIILGIMILAVLYGGVQYISAQNESKDLLKDNPAC